MATKRKTTTRKTNPEKKTVLSAIETAFCHLIIQGKQPSEAATELGLAKEDGARFYQRRPVQNYLGDYRAVFADKMAEREVIALVDRKITRETIAQRLLMLADTPPERTKGSIEGQVEALRMLSELYCMKIDPKIIAPALANMTDEQLAQYTGTSQ